MPSVSHRHKTSIQDRLWRRPADTYPASKPSARRLRKQKRKPTDTTQEAGNGTRHDTSGSEKAFFSTPLYALHRCPRCPTEGLKKQIKTHKSNNPPPIPVKKPTHATINPNRLWRRPADTYNQLTKPAYKTACGGVPPTHTTSKQNQHLHLRRDASGSRKWNPNNTPKEAGNGT